MPKKILVVDDDNQIVAMLTLGLQDAGFEVHSAQDGEEGLRKAQWVKPDLMILDLNMPVMNGFEVCQRVREDAQISNLKILITSAKSYLTDIKTAKTVGANSYIVKPFGLKQLLDAVNGLLAGA